MSASKNKIIWLSVLQGWSMLLVVMGHITLTNQFIDPTTPVASAIEKGIYSFHMPLFMFISGWLFYYTCIQREKSYHDVLISKLHRLGVPFLAFTLATTILKLLFAPLMKRPVNVQELIDTFVWFRSNPLGEMWFIVSLFILMAMYPLYRKVLQKKYAEMVWLVFALALYFFFPKDFNYFQLDKISVMMIFFYTGILTCKYDLSKIMKNRFVLAITVIVFIGLQCFFIPAKLGILTSFIGIILSYSLCMNLADRFPGLFHTFRDYTFQIFLMGIFFQMGIRFLYAYLDMESFYWAFYLVSILLGVYMPVIISKFIQRIPIKSIRACFGL